MKLTVRTVLEIAHHEAIIRQAYKDSVGVWTWSAGITSASGHKVERYIDNPQPIERCIEVYVWLLETKYLPAVQRAFAGHDLSESQLAAALSFHWNTGAIERAAWVQHFRAGDMAKARKTFMSWRKPKEIIPRRRAERDLFFDGKWAATGFVTEFTKVTSRSTPNWGSGQKVNIEAAVRRAMKAQPIPDHVPTAPRAGGWLASIIAALFGAFSKRKSRENRDQSPR